MNIQFDMMLFKSLQYGDEVVVVDSGFHVIGAAARD